MKKITIIGAYGFLGRHLNDYYTNRGCEVINLGRDYASYIDDVADSDLLINCAFIGGKESNTDEGVYKSNISISADLVKFLNKNNINIPIKFISSIQEDDPNSLYGKAKKESSLMLEEYCTSKGLLYESYKLPNLFGTYGRPYYNSFVQTFCFNIVNNIHTEYNTNKISLCHVSDAIKVIDNRASDYKMHNTTVEDTYNTLITLNEEKDTGELTLFELRLQEILTFYKKQIKVLVLGHKGMLGHMVHKYLSKQPNITTHTYESRFPNWTSECFEGYTYIINCIGAIPQKTTNFEVNWSVPEWLNQNTRSRIIHPGTDCEYDDDAYGLSKKRASDYIKSDAKNTKIIQASIIGPELGSSDSLLEWFLSQEGEVFGYTKAVWNGVTTLEWSKLCLDLINRWDDYPQATVAGCDPVSKFDLLTIIKQVYNKSITIKEKELGKDKTLNVDVKSKSIAQQLLELKLYK